MVTEGFQVAVIVVLASNRYTFSACVANYWKSNILQGWKNENAPGLYRERQQGWGMQGGLEPLNAMDRQDMGLEAILP